MRAQEHIGRALCLERAATIRIAGTAQKMTDAGLTTSKSSSSACLGRTPLRLAVVKTLADGLCVEACISGYTAPSPSTLLSRRALLNHRTAAATKSLQRNRGACERTHRLHRSEPPCYLRWQDCRRKRRVQRTPSCISTSMRKSFQKLRS